MGNQITTSRFFRLGIILCLWTGGHAESIFGQTDSLAVVPRAEQAVVISSAPPFQPSPTGALLRSAAFPGWGQYYNRKPVKGAILLLLEAGLLTAVLLEREQPPLTGLTPIGNRLLFGLIGVHIYGMTDAYVDAHLADFDTPDVFGRRPRDNPTVVVGFKVTW